jgi:hypothetical protein
MKLASAAFALACSVLFCHEASAVALAEIRLTHLTTGIDTGDPSPSSVISSMDLNVVSGTTENTIAPAGDFFPLPISIANLNDGFLHYFDVSYTITVSDQGLPGKPFSAAVPLHNTFLVSSDGPEVAMAALYVGYIDPRTQEPPSFQFTFFTKSLQTTADSTAESYTESGVARATLLYQPQPASTPNLGFEYGVSMFAFANTLPVPEPEPYALLLTGLAAMGVFTLGRSNSLRADHPSGPG